MTPEFFSDGSDDRRVSSVDKERSRREVASRAPHTSSHARRRAQPAQWRPWLPLLSALARATRRARVAARAGAKPVSAARAPLRVVAGESRIGKHPVPVPKGVTYTLKDNHLAVKVGAGHLLRSDSYSATRCDAVVRSRRRPRPTPVASVRAATDRVLGFWLALFF